MGLCENANGKERTRLEPCPTGEFGSDVLHARLRLRPRTFCDIMDTRVPVHVAEWMMRGE